ncbi:MAG: hypothetical protein KC457_15760 [Myxococcales bacterium]|nr:hypothetical protein [Myxococcales bacterium]
MRAAPSLEELYSQGQEKFDAGDFAGAAETWTEAIAAIEEGPESATRATIVGLAVDAHLQAYEASEDQTHVDLAKEILDTHEAALTEASLELSPELGEAKAKIQQILDDVAAAEAAAEEEARLAAEAEAKAAAEAEGPQRPPEPTWGTKTQHPMNGKGMIITGATVTGLGAAFIVTSILITRCDFESNLSCKYGNQRDLLVPTAVTTAALGVMLLGVGLGNRSKYKKWQNWTPEKAAVAPTFMPGGGGGVAVAGRF